MNYYERYCGDYAKKTARLSLVEHGAYTLLLDEYYSNEAPLPADFEELFRICRAMKKSEQDAVRSVAEKFFPIAEDGMRHNERADEMISRARPKMQASRANGAKGGRPRKNPSGSEEENLKETHKKPNGKPTGFSEQNPGETQSETTRARSPTPTPVNTKPLEEQYRVQTEVGPPVPDSSSPVSRSVEIAVYLRQRGVAGANSINPNIASWADDARVTNEILDAAISKARSSLKDGAPLGPNYLAPVIVDLLNPKPAVAKPRDDGAWKRTPAGIERKASELGIVCPPGRTHDWLREKCEAELSARAQRSAA